MWILVLPLAVVWLLPVLYLLALLREVRRISDSLEAIAGSDTNAEVITLTGNRRFRELAGRINRLLAAQRQRERQVRQADQAFKEAVTGISHDLRTPLTSVSGYLQMLRSGKTPPEKAAEYWEIVERRLDSLLTLLDELFEYTRVEAGEMTLQPEKLRLDKVLPEQLAMYYEEFTRRGLQPEIRIPPDPLTVFCDPKALERIIQNLIKNALVHGRERLVVTLEQNGDGAVMTFANGAKEGEAVPERLFERFYTADRSRTSKSTGLGLAIVRQLAGAMDGEASARWNAGLLEISLRIPLQRNT